MTKPIEDSANASAIRTALGVPTNADLAAKYTKPATGIPATDLDADPAGRMLLTATSAAERKQVLGLDQVNNTSDANKPVSTAQATALAAKMDATLPALQSVFDGGTAAQKAAFQSSVPWGDTRAAGTRIGTDGYRVAYDYIDVPTEITNCELWLDAAWAEKADGTACTASGDAVSMIRDGSGNGRHASATQGTPLYYPTGGPAGRPGFMGGKLTTTGFLTAAMAPACTMIVVTAEPGSLSAWKCKVSDSIGASGFYMSMSGSNRQKDWKANLTGCTDQASNWATAGGVNVFGWAAGSGNSVMAMDGFGRSNRVLDTAIRQSSGVTGGPAWTGTQSIVLGGFSGTTTDNWVSPISEFIMFSRLLTDAELLKIFAYLNQKYSALPLVRMIGNSITVGDDTLLTPAGSGLGSLMMAALSGEADVRLDAYPGRTTTQILAESPAYSALMDARKKKRITIVWELTNILNNSSSAAVAYQETVRICKRYRDAGAYVIVPTCLYRADGVLATFKARADNLNAMISANWPKFADGFVNLLADSRLQDPLNTTYFKTDKIHPTNPVGAAIVRDLLLPEVRRLLAL